MWYSHISWSRYVENVTSILEARRRELTLETPRLKKAHPKLEISLPERQAYVAPRLPTSDLFPFSNVHQNDYVAPLLLHAVVRPVDRRKNYLSSDLLADSNEAHAHAACAPSYRDVALTSAYVSTFSTLASSSASASTLIIDSNLDYDSAEATG
ncbi:hypothetical protein CGLO_11460 [Colletotrichum gloeosporioides Cg-14]|uniref:Uncharacterized protein n=1 Tax=Colletotrichum gloeosporioides (strain Cg-14) TaxID=1237896 RepID=T0LLS9_COLGC|nr:hypothetical protein CGLO_11460 [Colletotrichum gloeosporioides Cg-14]